MQLSLIKPKCSIGITTIKGNIGHPQELEFLQANSLTRFAVLDFDSMNRLQFHNEDDNENSDYASFPWSTLRLWP